MSFNICRGTLGSLAMFTAIRNASSRESTFALDRMSRRQMDGFMGRSRFRAAA
jgi:hypothetical protein